MLARSSFISRSPMLTATRSPRTQKYRLFLLVVLLGSLSLSGCVALPSAVGGPTSNAKVNGASTAPSITTQPVSADVTAGQTATFSVTATGTAPLRYQWQKDGSAVSGATSSSYTTPPTTVSANRPLFTVVVTNSAGSVTSNTATLNVAAASAVAPSITTQPVSADVTAGQTATFSVTAAGTAPLSYQWQKDGSAVSGATSSWYTTPPTTVSANRPLFSVVVTNSAGSATSNTATLNVAAASAVAPSITTQPVSADVTAGQT